MGSLVLLLSVASRLNGTGWRVSFTGQGAVKDHDPEDGHVFHDYFSNAGAEPALRGGTYVEMGALDGTTYSNTRFFDLALQWGGLLIEPSEVPFAKLQKSARARGRNTLVNAVVCAQNHTVRFSESAGGNRRAMSGVTDAVPRSLLRRHSRSRTRRMPCRPLASLLHEAGIRSVDFFSLDVEGSELTVLQTMDWAVPVSVLMVEQDGLNAAKDAAVRAMLTARGFRLAERVGLAGANEIWLGAHVPRAPPPNGCLLCR